MPLRGTPKLPVDLAVLELALALSALGEGETRIQLGHGGTHARAMRACLAELGVEIHEVEGALLVRGRGACGLTAPRAHLDAGASPAALALSVALLCGQRFGTRVTCAGDAAWAQPLVAALRARGAQVRLSSSAVLVAPLLEGEQLTAIEHVLAAPDPHAKAAILFSGLFSAEPTAVAEPLLSADHAERMLSAFGAPVRRMGTMSGFDPMEWNGKLAVPEVLTLPNDTAIASGVAAIASCVQRSRVVLEDIGVNPTRTGVLDALRLGGARSIARETGDTSTREPLARVVVEASALRGGSMGGELPLHAGVAQLSLCLLGIGARQPTRLELDAFAAPAPRWDDVCALLRAFGLQAELSGAMLVLPPGGTVTSARVAVAYDSQLAWLALSLAAIAKGESLVAELPALDERWEALLGVLSQLGTGARLEREPPITPQAADASPRP